MAYVYRWRHGLMVTSNDIANRVILKHLLRVRCIFLTEQMANHGSAPPDPQLSEITAIASFETRSFSSGQVTPCSRGDLAGHKRSTSGQREKYFRRGPVYNDNGYGGRRMLALLVLVTSALAASLLVWRAFKQRPKKSTETGLSL